MNKHYFSLMIDGGRSSVTSQRISLEEAMSNLWTYASPLAVNKGDGRLMAMGYRNDRNVLENRKESLFTNFSVMMIDCDNTQSDPKILEKFAQYLGKYEYWTYETASSTTERPKFRAFIPLDDELPWNMFVKKAIGHLFSDFVDEGASWFEEPLYRKLNTLKHHQGKQFPSKVLMDKIAMMSEDYNRKQQSSIITSLKMSLSGKKGDWHNLPSVKHCLEGKLQQGERDNSLNRACYALKKLGYSQAIPQFLDEVDVDVEFKKKFKERYVR